MVAAASEPPRVGLVGGSEVGVRFLEVLVSLRDAGKCDLVGAVSAHKAERAAPMLAPFAESAGVAVVASLDELIQAGRPDILFSAGNHLIFEPRHIAAMQRRIVNFHAAPLPEYRGSACPAFAILEGAAQFGVSFHLVAEALDSGPLLHVERFDIVPEWTAGDIDRECIARGVAAFARLAEAWMRGTLATSPGAPVGRAPYRRGDIEGFREIDLGWPAERIWRHVRACDWEGVLPPAFAWVGSRKVFLTARPRGAWL